MQQPTLMNLKVLLPFQVFVEKTGVIRLQPANSSMEPIFVSADQARDTQVIGKVIAVFRRL